MPADPDVLRAIPLFRSMTDEGRADVASLLEEAHFEAGKVICREDEPGGFCHIILSGEVEVAAHSKSGEKVVLATLGAGEFFGEISVIDGGKHSATCGIHAHVGG